MLLFLFWLLTVPADIYCHPSAAELAGKSTNNAVPPEAQFIGSTHVSSMYRGSDRESFPYVSLTEIDCQSNYMVIYFKFSQPFNGYIYPLGSISRCILWEGWGETDIMLKLKSSQDICSAPLSDSVPDYLRTPAGPLFIEHRVRIQWDTDLVQEYDTDVLLRCEQPYNYNSTIKFDLTDVVGEKNKAFARTHPGPQLWMEIQDGEGPNHPPLVRPVYPGQQLSLVFHLRDDSIFYFDFNTLHCWVTDGETERLLVPIVDGNRGLPLRPLFTQLMVIESGCSSKPKVFGNFQKYRDTIDGVKTVTQWTPFKAFRFPTTSRVLIQCDIQVCFEKCYPLRPCDPTLESRKKRRSLKEHYDAGLVQPEMLTMYRALDVLDPPDYDDRSLLGPRASLGSPTTLRPSTTTSEEAKAFTSTTKAPLLLSETGGAVETEIDCQRTFMNVTFKFSQPFNGFIYPFGFSAKCVLWTGRGETEVTLKLSQDLCGASDSLPSFSNPVFENRLMIQWDPILVQENDFSVTLRCNRPDDHTRTIGFNVSSVLGDAKKDLSIEKSHSGPKLWMDIQDGNTPSPAALIGPVSLGQTLSMVFTLGDDFFDFDCNVLQCWASDGEPDRPLDLSPPTSFLTRLQVIENGCSRLPKHFGNFQKLRSTHTNGSKITTQWVEFKAFRFPTSNRLLIQCDLEVCFEKCSHQKACDYPESSHNNKKRRSLNNTMKTEVVTLYRAIEVLPSFQNLNPTSRIIDDAAVKGMSESDGLSTFTFYGVIAGLGVLQLLIIVAILVVYFQRRKKQRNVAENTSESDYELNRY